jgi:hypothetical protein
MTYLENLLLRLGVFRPHPLAEWFAYGMHDFPEGFDGAAGLPMKRVTRTRGNFKLTLQRGDVK